MPGSPGKEPGGLNGPYTPKSRGGLPSPGSGSDSAESIAVSPAPPAMSEQNAQMLPSPAPFPSLVTPSAGVSGPGVEGPAEGGDSPVRAGGHGEDGGFDDYPEMGSPIRPTSTSTGTASRSGTATGESDQYPEHRNLPGPSRAHHSEHQDDPEVRRSLSSELDNEVGRMGSSFPGSPGRGERLHPHWKGKDHLRPPASHAACSSPIRPPDHVMEHVQAEAMMGSELLRAINTEGTNEVERLVQAVQSYRDSSSSSRSPDSFGSPRPLPRAHGQDPTQSLGRSSPDMSTELPQFRGPPETPSDPRQVRFQDFATPNFTRPQTDYGGPSMQEGHHSGRERGAYPEGEALPPSPYGGSSYSTSSGSGSDSGGSSDSDSETTYETTTTEDGINQDLVDYMARFMMGMSPEPAVATPPGAGSWGGGFPSPMGPQFAPAAYPPPPASAWPPQQRPSSSQKGGKKHKKDPERGGPGGREAPPQPPPNQGDTGGSTRPSGRSSPPSGGKEGEWVHRRDFESYVQRSQGQLEDMWQKVSQAVEHAVKAVVEQTDARTQQLVKQVASRQTLTDDVVVRLEEENRSLVKRLEASEAKVKRMEKRLEMRIEEVKPEFTELEKRVEVELSEVKCSIMGSKTGHEALSFQVADCLRALQTRSSELRKVEADVLLLTRRFEQSRQATPSGPSSAWKSDLGAGGNRTGTNAFGEAGPDPLSKMAADTPPTSGLKFSDIPVPPYTDPYRPPPPTQTDAPPATASFAAGTRFAGTFPPPPASEAATLHRMRAEHLPSGETPATRTHEENQIELEALRRRLQINTTTG